MRCSCLISERMLIQGTNRSDIPEAELRVCWNKDSRRRAWDSGKGEMEVLLSWMEPGDFTNFPLFFSACFFSSWRTAQFQWGIFFNAWPTFSGGLGCRDSSACSSSALLHPPPHPPRPPALPMPGSSSLRFCPRTKGTCGWLTWFANELRCKAEPRLSPL